MPHDSTNENPLPTPEVRSRTALAALLAAFLVSSLLQCLHLASDVDAAGFVPWLTALFFGASVVIAWLVWREALLRPATAFRVPGVVSLLLGLVATVNLFDDLADPLFDVALVVFDALVLLAAAALLKQRASISRRGPTAPDAPA